ncbi:Ribosome biogenesis protein Nop10 [Giardia duodenalis ATCC 50581]|uniref:Ribosome biogenesis protein Nop10 n=1 Tax=Giardia intestinalis (strain ATCC 50581 / GS clone H7) TaxID=598745 RepID=C6LWK8_GIAIB|nr:Ribosome biogenesis protein Nop10 [Giardia intestinalis ATCC 50581]
MILCKCSSCDAYTLEEACPHCGAVTRTAHPAKFSPDDKYSEQRVRFLSRFPGSSLMTSPAFTF